MSVRRQKPRDDSELAQRINTYVADPVADRYDRKYTDTHIRDVERKRAPWLRWRTR